MNLYKPEAMTEQETEQLLTRYFQAEMPKPWPAFRVPEANGATVPMVSSLRRKTRWMGRLALAASVAFLFLGYLALANMFPGTSGNGTQGTGLKEVGPGQMGSRPRIVPLNSTPKKVITPSGKSAIMEEGVIGDSERNKMIRIDMHRLPK